ncbi:Imm53 family immunity protein [Lysobacter sp. TAB13]|uniref:Imm53 family immunity protein n=1 Tax=Lysobacter sp. TAB13 TaxID=3233065 RepID=UPI003F96AF18
MNALAELQQWYARQDKNLWEEGQIEIKTFSNPCWFVSIRLTNTTLANAEFTDIDEGIAETAPWARCYIEENVWKGAGDDLERLVELFLSWKSANEKPVA